MHGVALAKANSAPHLDWPLSTEEKKGCVLRLFDKDVQAANELIRCSEEKLESLQMQLAKVQPTGCGATDEHAAHLMSTPPSKLSNKIKVVAAPALADIDTDDPDDAAEKLRAAIATATAALQALESKKGKKDQSNVESDLMTTPQGPQRARSEGPLVGILCKEPRRRSRGSSLGGEQRRVSFGTVDGEDMPPRNLEDSPVQASGVEPELEPELFSSDWMEEVAKNPESTASPRRPIVSAAANKEGSERWQRHRSKALPLSDADTDGGPLNNKSTGKGNPNSLPPRQRSSERPTGAPARQQRGSGATTPRRGQQAAATVPAPKRTGRVWRPPVRA